ncbi:hypothetical protein ABK040_006757 [Willaertia magna]
MSNYNESFRSPPSLVISPPKQQVIPNSWAVSEQCHYTTISNNQHFNKKGMKIECFNFDKAPPSPQVHSQRSPPSAYQDSLIHSPNLPPYYNSPTISTGSISPLLEDPPTLQLSENGNQRIEKKKSPKKLACLFYLQTLEKGQDGKLKVKRKKENEKRRKSREMEIIQQMKRKSQEYHPVNTYSPVVPSMSSNSSPTGLAYSDNDFSSDYYSSTASTPSSPVSQSIYNLPVLNTLQNPTLHIVNNYSNVNGSNRNDNLMDCSSESSQHKTSPNVSSTFDGNKSSSKKERTSISIFDLLN